MATRSSWEGYLQFNLISVPIKAFTATQPQKGKVAFHMIHDHCGERIRYKKVCPVHGDVNNDEIVSGHEEAKGEYITVKKEEIKKLKAENDQILSIDVFVRPELIDPLYDTGKSFFLIPDGKTAQKSYGVLVKVMEDLGRCAVGQIVLSGKKQIVMVRAGHGLMVMTVLYFDEQVKKPEAFDDELDDITIPAAEQRLASTLIETATAKKLDLSKYQDVFANKVERLLATKSARTGKKGKGDDKSKSPTHVINLMDALKQSLVHAKKGTPGTKPRARKAARRRSG